MLQKFLTIFAGAHGHFFFESAAERVGVGEAAKARDFSYSDGATL